MLSRNLIKNKGKRGFTLVELMIVVAIIGVLAALAIYGVTKYLANAKTAEARTAIGRIAKDAAAAYERETMAAGVLAAGTSAAIGRSLCATAAATVPTALTAVAGQKYQSTAAEWAAGDATTGWRCLRFSMQGPQYFLYGYSAGASSFTAYAQGDLDADGNASNFQLQGALTTDSTTGETTVLLSPAIEETDPEE